MKISAETVILVSFLAGGIVVYLLYYFTLKRLAVKIQSGKHIKNTFNLWRKLTKVLYPSALQEIILKICKFRSVISLHKLCHAIFVYEIFQSFRGLKTTFGIMKLAIRQTRMIVNEPNHVDSISVFIH